MMRLLRLPIAIAALSLLPAAACGGGETPEVVTAPFTAEHEVVFENGLDFVSDPESLEGRWREDWSRELDQRVTWADVVRLLTVQTVRTDVEPDQRTTFRLVTVLDRNLLGEAPDDIELKVHEDQPGFGTVDGNDQQILEHHFVAFIRWEQTAEGTIVPRWHLSPSSDSVVGRVEYLLERRRDVRRPRGRTTTVVHEAE